MHPLSIALGALLGSAATAAFVWYRHQKNALPADGHLSGRIVPETLGSPAPDGLIPKSGYATRDGFEWAYVVGPEDTSGGISAAVTGDDSRYQELLLVNPSMPKIGVPGQYTGDAWDFETLVTGDKLLLPVPWSRYIDQEGYPRGHREPFPSDPRSTATAVEASSVPSSPSLASAAGAPAPSGAVASGAPAPRALQSAPYNQPVAFGEAA